LIFSLTFGLLAVLHGSCIQNLNFMIFVVNVLIKGKIEKPSDQYLGLNLNLNLRHFGCYTFIFISFGESCLLVSWCAGGRCGIAGRNEDRARNRRPDAEDR
jgi:hypothetical protein